MIAPTIYPSITTTNPKATQSQLRQLTQLNINQICLFPTTFTLGQRKLLYQQLKIAQVTCLPLIHIRHDFTLQEIEYLITTFHTQAVNIHPPHEFPLDNDLSPYKHLIYVENLHSLPDIPFLKLYAGICLDLAHLEDVKHQKPDVYHAQLKLTTQFKIGCAHIGTYNSAYPDNHIFHLLSDFDYLKSYPLSFFPPITALEVENPLTEQLQAISYINTF